jgi:HEAT repeat protein
VLGESGSSHVRTEIQKRFVQDQSPAVRAEAAYHMAEVGGSETRSVLQSAFEKDPDRVVRRWIEAELNSLRGSD